MSVVGKILKRFFDIIVSFIGIICLSPIFFVLIIILLFVNKGRIFYLDERVGKHHKNINVLKFRSMYYDAETNIDKYLSEEQKEEWLRERKIDNDPRITKIGNFMRITSIDELPQLFNIFAGTLSFIGPRPITERELIQHFTEEEQKLMLSVRPGLISVWGVSGRNEISFESGERQKLELSYFEKLSLFRDLKILFQAIPAVLKRKGAK